MTTTGNPDLRTTGLHQLVEFATPNPPPKGMHYGPGCGPGEKWWYVCSCGAAGNPYATPEEAGEHHFRHGELAAEGLRLHPWVKEGDTVTVAFRGDLVRPTGACPDPELCLADGRAFAFRDTVRFVTPKRVYFGTGQASAEVADILQVNGVGIGRHAGAAQKGAS